MVYMIGMPPIMGQWPEEEFVDGNPREVKLRGPIADEMKPDISIRHTHQYEIGFPIAADNVPTIWRWASSQPLPDFFTPHGFPCISPPVKEIIERFEPGVHQFFPIKVIDKNGREIAQHFLWVVCNRVDGVDRERTNFILHNGIVWTTEYKVEGKWAKVQNARLVFNNRQTRGYHFWRDKHLKDGMIYASDEVGALLRGAGFERLGAGPRESV